MRFELAQPPTQEKNNNEEPQKQNHYLVGHSLYGTARAVIEHARHHTPSAFSRVNSSLYLEREHQEATWLDINEWSALEPTPLSQVLAESCERFLLRASDMPGPNMFEEKGDQQRVFKDNTRNCSVHSDGHTIVLEGCENLDIVSTPDATRIRRIGYHNDKVTQLMREYERPELFHPLVKYHDWGNERLLEFESGYSMLRLHINPQSEIELHSHLHRSENWQILSGVGLATLNGQAIDLAPGVNLSIAPNMPHACRNTSDLPMVIIETRHGRFISEDDVVATKPQFKPATISPTITQQA